MRAEGDESHGRQVIKWFPQIKVLNWMDLAGAPQGRQVDWGRGSGTCISAHLSSKWRNERMIERMFKR